MACGNSFFVLFALVAAYGFVLAQEASESSSNDPSNQTAPQSESQAPDDHEGRAGFGDIFGNNSSNLFGQFLSGFSQLFPFPGLGNNNSSSSPSIPFFPFLGSFGRSQSLDLMPDFDNQDSSPHDRFFFHSHSSSVPIGCNYTSQAGYSCAGCREQLICRENGVGRLRVCPFYAPYCYNGVCGSSVNTTCTNSTG